MEDWIFRRTTPQNKKQLWLFGGLFYGFGQLAWAFSVLPSEWSGVPTQLGVPLLLLAMSVLAAVLAVPWWVWGWCELNKKGWLGAVTAAVLWQFHPLGLLQPGYFLAFTPWENIAIWGGIFGLTVFVLCMLRLLCVRPLWFVLIAIGCLFLPGRTIQESKLPSNVHLVQEKLPRQQQQTPDGLAKLLEQQKIPDGDWILLPEVYFQDPVPPKFLEILRPYRVVAGWRRFDGQNTFNSIVLLDRGTQTVLYDKQRLVPFFEWLGPPGVSSAIHFLTNWVSLTIGTQSQNYWQSPWGKIGIFVCWEVGWPGAHNAQSYWVFSDERAVPWFAWWRSRLERIRTLESGRTLLKVSA